MTTTVALGLVPAAFLIGYLVGYRQSRKREAAITAGVLKVMAQYEGNLSKGIQREENGPA